MNDANSLNRPDPKTPLAGHPSAQPQPTWASGEVPPQTGLVSPRTTTELLNGLHDACNQVAWIEFDARYRPIIFGVALRLGLSHEDAADVAQQTMLEAVRDYRLGKYERGRGRLRSWIAGIARNRAHDLQRSDFRRQGHRGDSAIGSLADSGDIEQLWDSQQQAVILAQALDQLRRESRFSDVTLRLFELVTQHDLAPDAAAAACGVTVDQVYLARSRVGSKLRQIVDELASAYHADD